MFGKKKKEEKEAEAKEEQPTPAEEPAGQPSQDAGAAEAKPAADMEGLKNLSTSPANESPEAAAPAEEPAKPAAPEQPSPEPVSEEPEEKPVPARKAKPKKRGDPEYEKLKKQLETQKESLRALEREKEDAMKKSDELASLIEDLSGEIKEGKGSSAKAAPQPVQQPVMPDLTPKLKEIEEKTSAQIKGIQEVLQALAEKKDEEKKDDEDVAATMKKMFDKRLKELSDKLEESKAKPAPGTGGAPGEVSGGLSAIGGGLEVKKEIDGLKKSLKDMATLLDAFKEEAENRFMAIDREMQVIERFPELEQKMEQFEKKLGPENVQRLRMLISSADDLKEEVIPVIVKREVDEKIEPHAKKVKAVSEALEKSDQRLQETLLELKAGKKDIASLFKLEERISKLEEAAGGLKTFGAELKTSLRELEKSQRKEMLDKMKELFPQMLEAEASSIRKEFAGRFAFIGDKMHSIENLAAEAHKDIAALEAMKGEMEALDGRIEDLKDDMEKTGMKIEALRSKDGDLLDKIEDLQTPKEVITELDNKTKDILDIREFFVRRTNQLDERIKQLDERAVPTQKLNEKVDSLVERMKQLAEMHKDLETKVAADTKQFQELIKQHGEEKTKLEDKLKEQKTRIGVLLKEFK